MSLCCFVSILTPTQCPTASTIALSDTFKVLSSTWVIGCPALSQCRRITRGRTKPRERTETIPVVGWEVIDNAGLKGL
jgi:hypothetical protein